MMGKSISYQLLRNYGIMIVLTTALTIMGLVFLAASNTMYDQDSIFVTQSATNIIKDDYTTIDTSLIEKIGGGMQVIDSDFHVLYSKGNRIFDSDQITPGEFTEYLATAEQRNSMISTAYNEYNHFWLIVSLPIAIKTNLNINLNPEFYRTFYQLIKVVVGYLIILLVSIFIYSKVTSRFFIEPLKNLCKSVKLFQTGDYSVRTELLGSKEIMELQSSFNDMAQQVETQTELKNASEENRKKLMMDISHDLKNPLMSVIGYAEMLKDEIDPTIIHQYFEIILSNGLRANELVKDLFELSKMEKPEFQLQCEQGDFTEYFRNEIIRMFPELESSGLNVSIDIPDVQVICNFDSRRMRRVIFNLLYNAISYCGGSGDMCVQLKVEEKNVAIIFANSVNQKQEEPD